MPDSSDMVLPVNALRPRSLLFTAARVLHKVTTAARVCYDVQWKNLPYACLCWFCLNLSVTHNLRFHSVEILCVISGLRTSVCTFFPGIFILHMHADIHWKFLFSWNTRRVNGFKK
jgi:hypothetical protein